MGIEEAPDSAVAELEQRAEEPQRVPRRVEALQHAIRDAQAPVAGEELAWGQHLFAFETPEWLAEVNYKEETSLHNVESLVAPFNLAKLVIGAYGLLGAWVLFYLARRVDVSALDLFVVPVFLSSAFLFLVVQRLLRYTLLRDTPPPGWAGSSR